MSGRPTNLTTLSLVAIGLSLGLGLLWANIFIRAASIILAVFAVVAAILIMAVESKPRKKKIGL